MKNIYKIEGLYQHKPCNTIVSVMFENPNTIVIDLWDKDIWNGDTKPAHDHPKTTVRIDLAGMEAGVETK